MSEHTDRKVAQLGAALDELAAVVEGLADAVEALQAAPPSKRYTSWFLIDEPGQLAEEWERLTGWLAQVLRHHPDVAAVPHALRPCWVWHPWVIEELRALRWAWDRAYSTKGGPDKILDWHERACPGTIRRLQAYLSACDIERHSPNARDGVPPVPPAVPSLDAGERLLPWWLAGHGTSAPPPPSREDLASARAV